jgi:hypothetical protein
MEKVDKTADPDVTTTYYCGQTPAGGLSWQLFEAYKDSSSAHFSEKVGKQSLQPNGKSRCSIAWMEKRNEK